MSAPIDALAFRAIITKIQDYLTDNDRQRLHFFLGCDVPKRIRDDSSLTGTFELVESLFQQDIINEKDFTFLIDAFDEIKCFDAVKILREYRRQMQESGQFESIRSLTSILLQDVDECKMARENIVNDRTSYYGDDNGMMEDKTTKISPMNIFVEKPSSQKSLLIGEKVWSMLKLSLVIGLSIGIGICITTIITLNDKLKEKDQTIANKDTMITKYDEPHENLIKIESLCEKRSRPRDFATKLRNSQQRNGITVAGIKGYGEGLDQLKNAQGFYVDENETIYIADTDNHRIVAWKKDATSGELVAGGKGQGSENNTFNSPVSVLIDNKTDSFIIADYGNKRIVRWPRENGTTCETIIRHTVCLGLAIDHEDYLYVSDHFYAEVSRWRLRKSSQKIPVVGHNGQGYSLDQFNDPRHIFIDEDGSLYVSEVRNHRAMKFLKNAIKGIVIAGGHGTGTGFENLHSPHGIFVDRRGTLYIADTHNDRVVRWLKDAKEGELVVGGNGRGNQSNQFNQPKDLTFDQHNNLYVLDSGNNRVQKFLAANLK